MHSIYFTYSLRWICDGVNWFWGPHQVFGGGLTEACAGSGGARIQSITIQVFIATIATSQVGYH